MTKPRKRQQHWSPAWVAVVAALAAVALAQAGRLELLPFPWWGVPALAVACCGVNVLGYFIASAVEGDPLIPLPRLVFTVLAWLAPGAWIAWATLAGFTPTVWFALAAGAIVLGGVGHVTRRRTGSDEPESPDPADAVRAVRRPSDVRSWEATLRQQTREAVTVTAVTPWDKPKDGQRIDVDLAPGMTWKDLAAVCDRIASARHLPQGCAVRALEGRHQGAAILDVMLRDCLADEIHPNDDFTPGSINDEFAIMHTPRGELLSICLRLFSMIVGGTTGAGKTTLLHRIILRLAFCVDAIIWVVDLNGGGVAEPFMSAWARGKAKRPPIDWVADCEEEAAVLVAVAAAVGKDRKTAPEAVRRKREGDTTVLPVDAKLPAIVVITDEGGEIGQAVGLLGKVVGDGIKRLAQIGRAEGVRVVMSVLRGTADLLDKGLRVNAAVRVCLRMEEEDEYSHILGQHPGNTRIIHTGAGYLRRSTDYRPIFARSVNVLRSTIERASIACADLRPELDGRGQRVAARVRAVDVLGGREPSPEFLDLPVMRDVEAGRAYSGRWDRYAHRLAAMRGEELPELEERLDNPPPSASVAQPSSDGPLGALLEMAGMTATAVAPAAVVATHESVDDAFNRMVAEEWAASKVRPTTRDHIVDILATARPRQLTSDEIGVELEQRGKPKTRTYRQDVLKIMRERGEVVQPNGAGTGYTVPE